MQSLKNSATWISSTYTQEAIDTDWTAYQVSLTGTSKAYNIYSATTTSTQLSLYDGPNIVANQPLLLSTNGSTFTSGVAGAITTSLPVFPTPTKVTANSSTSATNLPSSGTSLGAPLFIKPDGTKLWRVIGTTLTEYTLSTPFDFTTAAANGRTIASFSNYGFCFSADGSRLHSCDGTYFYTRVLGLAWDITTAGALSIYTMPASTAACRQMRISSDGQYVAIMTNGSAGNTGNFNKIYTYQCATPNQLVTTTNIGISSTFATAAAAYCGGFEFSPDGKVFIVAQSNGSATPVANVTAYTCNTPWIPNSGAYVQLGATFTLTNSDFSSLASTVPMGMVGHPLGTSFTVFFGVASYATFSTDFNTKQNINIQNFNLGTAPTYAYAQSPRVFVDMEATSGQVTLMPIDQDFISATTSQVIFGANGAGLVATNDKLLLNGNTSVSVSSVSAGSTGGLTAQYLGRGVNYIKDSGKTFGLPFTPYSMKVRADGSALYFTTGNANIYQYSLTTPWDITTAYLANLLVLNSTSVTGYTATNNGVDFKPDGTKMYVNAGNGTGYCYEFTLSTPWNIGTAVYTNRKFVTVSSSGVSTYGGRFNETGTQYYYQYIDASGCNTYYYLYYVALSTPYDLSSAGSYASFYSSGTSSNTPGGSLGPVLAPGGNTLLTIGNAVAEQVLSTPNSLSGGFSSTQAAATSNTNAITFPGIGLTYASCIEFSPDGTRIFVVRNSIVYMFKCRTKPLTQYTANFATQSFTPTSVYFPDRSVEQSITTTLSGGNMTFATSQILKGGRAVGMKVLSPIMGTTISNLTLNLWKT
jgi:hypothetical protein